jgi:mannose-1-phosphate guanylyltransferase / mannose-6-phosphate isomerase
MVRFMSENGAQANVVPVIISGGAGARLWPLSRESHPKPLIKLGDGQSLIQHAFRRALALPGVVDVLTVTNRELLFLTDQEYREIASNCRRTFLLEPEGRDTAAAVAVATLEVARSHGRDAVLCVFPADHMIRDTTAFVVAAEQAIALAGKGRLVTFGITPEAPETGYGYIEAKGVDVVRFVEKPDRATAEDYLSAGTFLWNSGMFCFAAGTMLDLMDEHCPDILADCEKSLAAARRAEGADYTYSELDPTLFAMVRKDSLDYAILEKAPNVAVIACDIGWSDIGSWTSLGELTDADGEGNRVIGEAVMVDTRDCIVQAHDRLVGTVGINDLIIVDSSDALLVASKDRVQEVKTLFNRLKMSNHTAHRHHRKIQRSWGTYSVIEEAANFKIKRIEVKPGARLSLQMHYHRSEHWVVVSGTAKVVNGGSDMVLTANQSTYIPSGNRHRLENPGLVPLVLIEVQSGEYLGEDDIVRFD